MPSPLLEERQRLRSFLVVNGPASRQELAQALRLVTRTVTRMLAEIGGEVLAAGATRQRRFAMRRPLRGELLDEPLYAIDDNGAVSELGRLNLVRPEGSFLDLSPTPWPVDADTSLGWWAGLPYPIVDVRPQGFLGRLFGKRHGRDLGLDANPDKWSDDAVVVALRAYGVDTVGNLVLGHRALEQVHARWLEPACPGRETDAALSKRYVSLAERTMQEGIPGSSAGGEFPKFLAARRLKGARTPHCIVKFSGADGSTAVQRWADLLVCEHLALQALAELPGHQCARSRVLQHAGRTFLESERFDRHGDHGRSPLVSLLSIEAAFIGNGGDWSDCARKLATLGWLSSEQVQRVDEMLLFSRLIANSDTHLGNLSLVPRSNGTRKVFDIAPAYDLLPMAYAPLRGGELPQPQYTPPFPPPGQSGEWARAFAAAERFWDRAAGDARISEGFRAICASNLERMRRAGQLAR